MRLWFITHWQGLIPSTVLCGNQCAEPLEVISDRFESEFELILHQPQVTRPAVMLPFLEMGKDAFNMAAMLCFTCVARMVIRREFDVVRPFFKNAIGNAMGSQPRGVRLAIVSFVGIGNPRIRIYQLFKHQARS